MAQQAKLSIDMSEWIARFMEEAQEMGMDLYTPS
jgi:hypothetical protein